jgi:multidrug efflux pump subunit AcrA (membrane-fusion protein)
MKAQTISAKKFALLAFYIVAGSSLVIVSTFVQKRKEQERARTELKNARAKLERLEAARKDDLQRQEKLEEPAKSQTQALLSYVDTLVRTSQATVEHRQSSPYSPILGAHGEKTIGDVRFIKRPYPSLQQMEQVLGKPSKCDRWPNEGEVLETWCEWSVVWPDEMVVSVQARFSPKLDSGAQKLSISRDISRRTSEVEDIGRLPSMWSKDTQMLTERKAYEP